MTIRQALVFAILMENNDGVLGKAPSYMEEKLNSAGSLDEPECLLDSQNLAKFNEWQKRWQINLKKEGGEK